jgi:hypothetical protein
VGHQGQRGEGERLPWVLPVGHGQPAWHAARESLHPTSACPSLTIVLTPTPLSFDTGPDLPVQRDLQVDDPLGRAERGVPQGADLVQGDARRDVGPELPDLPPGAPGATPVKIPALGRPSLPSIPCVFSSSTSLFLSLRSHLFLYSLFYPACAPTSRITSIALLLGPSRLSLSLCLFLAPLLPSISPPRLVSLAFFRSSNHANSLDLPSPPHDTHLTLK